jgi:hypothetical protein
VIPRLVVAVPSAPADVELPDAQCESRQSRHWLRRLLLLAAFIAGAWLITAMMHSGSAQAAAPHSPSARTHTAAPHHQISVRKVVAKAVSNLPIPAAVTHPASGPIGLVRTAVTGTVRQVRQTLTTTVPELRTVVRTLTSTTVPSIPVTTTLHPIVDTSHAVLDRAAAHATTAAASCRVGCPMPSRTAVAPATGPAVHGALGETRTLADAPRHGRFASGLTSTHDPIPAPNPTPTPTPAPAPSGTVNTVSAGSTYANSQAALGPVSTTAKTSGASIRRLSRGSVAPTERAATPPVPPD